MNSGLAKAVLMLGYELVIMSHSSTWMELFIHAAEMHQSMQKICDCTAYSIHGVMSLLNLQVHYAQVTPQLSWMNDQEFR